MPRFFEKRQPRQPFLAWLVVLASALAPALARGDGKKSAPLPTAAFVDLSQSTLVALLEARLLADASATWVERTAIDKLLKEQTLQAAFGPQGGPKRIQLGKLLKADMLVLVRPVKKTKDPALEVVVSDTARGLRLAVRVVPVTGDADRDVAALKNAVHAGLKKFREALREVLAVPPFTSTNLGYEHDHLKGAYAKLVEQAALAHPGVVVVELEEAEAIAREIKLADPGATLKRQPPLYLLGDYRHQGRGADLQVSLRLRSTRGGKPIGEPLARTVAAGNAPTVLRQWVGDRLADKAVPRVALDPKVEAKQLAELSRSRQRVADWSEAIVLLEASLLLDPNQPELNADAMAVIKVQMDRIVVPGNKDTELLRRLAQLHHRGFAHMEVLVSSGARLPRFDTPDGARGGRMFFSPFPFPLRPLAYSLFTPPADSPEVKELIRELEQQRRDVCLRLLPLIVKDGTRIEVLFFTHTAVWELPIAERYEEYARLILEYQKFPAMTAAASGFVFLPPTLLTLGELPIYRKFLDHLEKDGNAGVRAAVKQARQSLPGVEKQIAKRAAEAAEEKRLAESKQPRPEPGRVTDEEKLARLEKRLAGMPLQLIRLTFTDSANEWHLGRLRGLVAAGPGIDVFYGIGNSGPALFVMKEKGRLRRVWETTGGFGNFADVCFDGRYVWFVTDGWRTPPQLFVFDPLAEKVYEVTADDGLPQPPADLVKDRRNLNPPSLRVTPLDQGRVCLAGGFGRAWVGIARFDAARKKTTVSVIHEAREVSNQADNDAWPNPNLAFTPSFMHVLRGAAAQAGKTSPRVLIGRKAPLIAGGTGSVNEVGGHPLIIDPERPGANVMKDVYYHDQTSQRLCAMADGSARVVQSKPGTGELHLLRIDFPGTVRNLGELAAPRPAGSVAASIFGGRLYIVVHEGKQSLQPGGGRAIGSSWWTADLDGKNLRKLAADLPPIQTISPSSHYGLVAWINLVPGIALCKVTDQPLAAGPPVEDKK